MRLAKFIETNIELILVEWEVFACSVWPKSSIGAVVNAATLRDDAEGILRATVLDMQSRQSLEQQSAKSKGEKENSEGSRCVDKASESHGIRRVDSGFDLSSVVAEYRALRASVLRLWRQAGYSPDLNDIDDVTRFNECIDQSLSEAVHSYTEQASRDREAMADNELAARRDAETANRAKDMFLATLSHELRTPLNAIVGWVNILRHHSCGPENLAEGLNVIERNTKSQVQLIEDVLDISRIVSGKLRLDIRECDFIETVNADIEVVRPTAEARNISIETELDPIARRASCDAMRIQQVVWNLLSNAIKFTPKGGIIRVTLGREQSTLQLTVKDNGQGINSKLLPYIFERFRQADSSTRRTYGGLGLGLSIVKHLTEMHGGTVKAESAGEGLGTSMTIRLPIKAIRFSEFEESGESEGISHAASTTPGLPPVRLDNLHVLIVDDEPDARQMLKTALEWAGARITTAGSVADAIDVLSIAANKGPGIDLMVSDVGMPNRDGYDLIREVRAQGRDLPAVALTAYAHSEDVRRAVEAGFQMHMPKPVDLRELTEVISRLSGRTR